jgi:hypothetical protein
MVVVVLDLALNVGIGGRGIGVVADDLIAVGTNGLVDGIGGAGVVGRGADVAVFIVGLIVVDVSGVVEGKGVLVVLREGGALVRDLRRAAGQNITLG